jgi:hypothetical protein
MGGTRAAVSELDVARAVAAAAAGVAGVASVSPGRFARVGTYGPGELVRGVAVSRAADALAIAIHIRARYRPAAPLPALADRVRAAARGAVAGLGAGPVGRIDVAVDDLVVEEGVG